MYWNNYLDIVLQLFIIIPIIGFLFALFIPFTREKLIAKIVLLTVLIHLLLVICFLVLWIMNDSKSLNLKEFVLFKAAGFEFFIDFYFDKITAVFALVGSFLTLLITKYSSEYLHREVGYKRFFNTIQLFYLGYNIIIFSGNFETLFIGWEILGISSFLLIAFYADRFLPVKNAIKVFSIYRIGDVGIILTMWLSHHLWHESITFNKLFNYELVHHQLESHTFIGVAISSMILLSACVKSAQFPFSSWLPRAMEGPTPSSAIFYGSLAVHLGVFLLLRTFHFWEHQISIRIVIVILGVITSFVATAIARAQSSIKSQIAYSSIAQIGIIFIEISLGLDVLALVHFAGNAFLRSYQLLVSPSMVSYSIREKFFTITKSNPTIYSFLPIKIKNSIYINSVKEWDLDLLMYTMYWSPLRKVSFALSKIPSTLLLVISLPAFILFYIMYEFHLETTYWIHLIMPQLFSMISLLIVLRAFSESKSSVKSWSLLLINHFWISLSIMYNEHFKNDQIVLYLSGVVVSGVLGYFFLFQLYRKEGIDSLTLIKYQGHSYEYPKIAFGFLLACLGLSGFPITPTFVGEDLIFFHIHEDQISLAVLTSVCFVVEGLAILRIYAKLFMGPHIKNYHEIAYKSA